MSETKAEVELPTSAMGKDLGFFAKVLKMRMERIWPADDPQVAVFSGHGLRVRLDTGASGAPAALRIVTHDPDGFAEGRRELQSPGGTRVTVEPAEMPVVIPDPASEFIVRRLADNAPWVIGRAGMAYRDLIPGRLGGSIIASHIRIEGGGRVPDMVHYHDVGFQLIFCLRGWVDLVYEDQGPPFRLHGGNCVIQPPQIRHRVLYASPDVEVLEIGVPAEHITTIDHDMDLPNGPANPDRVFSGQTFIHSRAEDHVAAWQPFRLPGFEARDTGIRGATGGVACVRIARPADGEPQWARHDCGIHFSFVMRGTLTLEVEGEGPRDLTAGDAFTLPPGQRARHLRPSDDLQLMEVALPGDFRTELG